MSTVELILWLLTIFAVVPGALGVLWGRGEERHFATRCGRWLFVVLLLVLGVAGLVAAAVRAHGLPPLGLLAGLLVVAMVWENPGQAKSEV